MSIITRFAPSPTGDLHIGSARTALFNYLYAKHNHGKFLLRIEDTDQARSTKAATLALLSGLEWLGINWDGEIVYQAARNERHLQIAQQLVDQGKAYHCYTTAEEIERWRQEAIIAGKSFLFSSPWRNVDKKDYPNGKDYVIRLKAPQLGVTTIKDQVQGSVTVENKILDDMVLVRSDGRSTYMLAVVVDDHDMGITHIIRGDDHLNNAFRQYQLYKACSWEVPVMAHIPLIHGPDGTKLSKRHGAIGVEAYKDMGYLPEALSNYLLKLGWSYNDLDIISSDEAIEYFDIINVVKSHAKLDFAKMKSINGHYIRQSDDQKLMQLILESLYKQTIDITDEFKVQLLKAMPSLKLRAQLISGLVELSLIYHPDDIYPMDSNAIESIKGSQSIVEDVIRLLNELTDLSSEGIQLKFKELANDLNIKINVLMQPIRVLITGKNASPSVFEIINIIGKNKAILRLKKYLQYTNN